MAIVNITTLKTKFESGDRPGSTDYINLIDTMAALPSGIPTGTTAPTSPVIGQLYYNSNDRAVYFYNGQQWSVIASVSAPDAPTIGTVSSGNATASIEFTEPDFTGNLTITGYTATSNPGNLTATGSSSPISFTGLTNGTEYTFTVTATNSHGTSIASQASEAVTPTG